MTASRPRVLTVTPRYLPEMGGVESHVQQVMTRLADEYEFTLVTSDNGLGLPPRDVLDGVPVMRVPAYPRGRDWRFAPGVASAVRAAPADLLHVQGVHTFVSILAMAAARRRGLPYVVTFHTGGHSSEARNRIRGAQWRAVAPLLRGARMLVCVAEFEREFFSSVLGLPTDRFVVIRNGGELPPAGDHAPAVVPHRIISVGRLERYKGHHRLIAAMPLVREQIPDAELLVVGAGPHEAALRADISRRGLDDAVTITAVPPADRAAMGDLLGSAALFALMSEYEAHPLAVMEAVALGKPAVVADTSGLGELARNGLAHSVPVDADDATVAAALVRQLREPQPPSGPVETATWDATAAGVATVYREALEGLATDANSSTSRARPVAAMSRGDGMAFGDAPASENSEDLTISVIICAYTEQRWDDVLAAVRSVEQQSLPPHEIILVVDHNPALFQRLTAQLPDVRVVENQQERGLSGGKNTGVALSSGSIVAFLDDDAIAEPGWLKFMADAYTSPDVVGVGGTTLPRWETGRPRWFPEEFDWVVGCTFVGREPGPVRNLLGGNASFRREVFDVAGGFPTGIGRTALDARPLGGEETEFCIRVSQRIPTAMFFYEPRSVIHHWAPAARERFAYFRSRCYAEGLSKALVTESVGTRDGLSAEREYTRVALRRGILRGVRQGLRGDVSGWQRAGAIVTGLAAAAWGYGVGRVRSRVTRFGTSAEA